MRIADVTGFSVTKGRKMLERTVNVMGNGTVLAQASVKHGVAEKIEQWFRSDELFGADAAPPSAAPHVAAPVSVADELRKLRRFARLGGP